MPDPTEPSPGDIVFCCEHLPDPLEAHLHFVDARLGYAKTDGKGKVISRLLAKWLVLCDACDISFGDLSIDDLLDTAEAGTLKIGGDMAWPDDVETLRVRAKVDKLVDEKCPPGWAREMVRPPWAHKKGNCRACGKTAVDGERWGVATLMRFDEERKVLKFSFAMVCASCVKNETKMDELSKRVFDAQ